MSDSLDPELARALQEPARLVRADPALLDTVRQAGSPAQAELMRRVSDVRTVEDIPGVAAASSNVSVVAPVGGRSAAFLREAVRSIHSLTSSVSSCE